MKNSLGEDMPGVTRENIGEICSVLTKGCGGYHPDYGGVTFILEEDPEQPPIVKLLITTEMGAFSIPLTDEQVHGALESIRNLSNYMERQVMLAMDNFEGFGGMDPGPGEPTVAPTDLLPNSAGTIAELKRILGWFTIRVTLSETTGLIKKDSNDE